MKRLLLAIIIFYRRFISPIKPPSCRFQPTCSEYAHTAISRHGVLKGVAIAVNRILRCNPFNKGGYDPVPEQLPEQYTVRRKSH
ncbi:MAG TPA: membrane protein insertion efficiency factor YidD [Kosmotogaceae bacterium]|nr:membrane protein insertion efficiency factor YidD [Kosmotogaceae bacterium]